MPGKDEYIQVRFTKEEKEEIKKYAEKLGFNMSNLIRNAIFEKIRGINEPQTNAEVDSNTLNRILEKLDLLNGKSTNLKLQNKLLRKMMNLQQNIAKQIPEKTIEEQTEKVVKAIEFYRTQLSYRVKKIPMSTKKIIEATKLPMENVIAILEKNKGDLFKQIKRGWDLIND